MNKENSRGVDKSLIDEIKVFIDYGVSEGEKEAALQILATFEDNNIALNVLRDFYARLPDFREEAVIQINKITSRLGAYLLEAKTRTYEYLYFYDGSETFYLGEKKEGIGEDEILSFFGYSSNEAFFKQQDSSDEDNAALSIEKKHFCPACSVGEGEIHHLGCPVEVCPWCDGQLNYCNCRFEKLGVDEIEDEAMLDRFEIILNDKGRIPFTGDHFPAYPGAQPEDEQE